jgi:NAD-dependent dihydropyrimidine dehydrogenase PreA subunit
VPYVIASPCVDTMDRSCIEECPVDCIYEGGRKLYINPLECIDCGACEPVCPVEAIHHDSMLPEALRADASDNRAFFTEVLPGRPEPLGTPGGGLVTGPIGADTPQVTALRRRSPGTAG